MFQVTLQSINQSINQAHNPLCSAVIRPITNLVRVGWDACMKDG